MAKKAKDLKPGDREYNADTDKWNEKKPKTKPTPASNTRKKMKKAAASAPKPTTKPKKKAPIPKNRPRPGGARPEGKAAGMPAKKKAPVEGLIKLVDPAKKKEKPAFTKGGNTGDKTSKYEKMSSIGISLNVKKKPKAKLSK